MQERIAEIATGTSYTASAGTIVFGLTVNEWGVLIGTILAIATFVVNWVYRHKHYQLRKQEQGISEE